MTKLQLFLWLPPAAVHLATSAPLHYYYNIYHYNRNDFIEARISGVFNIGMDALSLILITFTWIGLHNIGKGHR